MVSVVLIERKLKEHFITSQVWDANVVHFSKPVVSTRTLQRQLSEGNRCLVSFWNICVSALSSCMDSLPDKVFVTSFWLWVSPSSSFIFIFLFWNLLSQVSSLPA